jgi:hypothetical protein
MGAINLPASLFDMFQAINDRLNRIELGYNGPQASADAAQSTAVSAQSLALTSQSVATNAQLQAANASVQAVQAQSQATLASSQATYAVTTANGKNTVAYGTAAPPSGTHTTGDLYFQFNGSNQVIAQYTWNGSSWVSNSITSTVIASINAGTIVSGTITGIEFNNGSGTFHVTPAGVLTASSANITGTIVAQSGYIGNTAGGSYWSITSSGITGFGSANITGGLISGSSIYIGSSGQFQVDAAGNLNASSANITGTIHASSGTVGGFTIGSTYLSSGVNFYLNASTGDANFNSVSLGNSGIYYFSYLGALSASSVNTTGALNIGTSAFIGGGTEVAGNLQVDSLSSVVYSSANYNIGLFGTGSGGTAAGRMYKTTSLSSKRFKHNIEPFIQRDYLHIVSKLEPVTFNYNADIVDNPETIAYGLIAEDVQTIPETEDLVNIGTDGLPESIAYDRLIWYTIKAISQINDRLIKLEGK